MSTTPFLWQDPVFSTGKLPEEPRGYTLTCINLDGDSEQVIEQQTRANITRYIAYLEGYGAQCITVTDDEGEEVWSEGGEQAYWRDK